VQYVVRLVRCLLSFLWITSYPTILHLLEYKIYAIFSVYWIISVGYVETYHLDYIWIIYCHWHHRFYFPLFDHYIQAGNMVYNCSAYGCKSGYYSQVADDIVTLLEASIGPLLLLKKAWTALYTGAHRLCLHDSRSDSCGIPIWYRRFILVSSISYRYTSIGLATVVFFFIGATVSAKLALSVPFACCW